MFKIIPKLALPLPLLGEQMTVLTSEYICLCVSVCCVCRPGKGVGSLGAGVTGCVCTAGHGYSELNSGPLEKQQTLEATETSLQLSPVSRFPSLRFGMCE